jgi:aryl-alcohol dehydrogenase-like predicted oxidoreductase
MTEVTLGRTGIRTGCIGLECGALTQYSFDRSRTLLQKAMDAGVRFYDIGLPEEELQKRIGHGLIGQRSEVILAGSFVPDTPQVFRKQLEKVLRGLKTDYLDLCQIHDPDYMPRRGDAEGVYDAMLQAQEKGYIRHIGITSGNVNVLLHALEFGWYDTVQYPWSRQSEEEEIELLRFCRDAEVGSLSAPPETWPTDPAEEARFLQSFDDHLSLWTLSEEAWPHLAAMGLPV